MKTKLPCFFAALALLALVTLNSQLSTAHAQGTAFTYSGQLQNNGSPAANGLYDFQFALSNAPSGGSQVGSMITTTIGVTNGLFTTTLDFGAVFSGNATWLGISVRPNGVGNYFSLTPLQELTPTPYAVFAESGNAAGLNGTIPAANFGGTYGNVITLNNPGNSISGNGSGLTSLNAAQLTGKLGNAQLANSSVTINTGTGLTGGGVAALGGSLTLNTAAGALTTPVSIPGTTQTAVPNTSYAVTNVNLTTINLPTTANVGDVVQVNGTGIGGWQVGGDILGSQGFVLMDQFQLASAVWQSVASSADGTRLVAVINDGGIYTSADSGATWTAANAPSEFWQSVASSSDGTHLVAVVNGGGIYTNNGGTWTPASAPSEAWASVASSSDGIHLVAVVNGGGIYTNSGGTWTATSALAENWAEVASSGDGTHLVALAGTFGNPSQIYTSTDSGGSWTLQTGSGGVPLSAVASSSDGTRLVVVGYNHIFTSIDSGVTWKSQAGPPDKYWQSVASSSDGINLVMVNSFSFSSGDIYTAALVVQGSQGSSEQFQYVGSGVWEPIQANGTSSASGSITINTGTGLSGGGTVALGGSLTLSATGSGSGLVSVTGNSDITATTVAGAVTLGDTATSAKTANTIVKRDGSGNFSMGTITLAGSLNLPAIVFDDNAAEILSGTVPILLNDSFGNLCVGQFAGHNLPPPFDTQPGGNTVVGVGGLFQDSSNPADNTAFGFEALSNSLTSMNTAVGYQALSAETTGGNNIALGILAGSAIVTGSGNIDIGNVGNPTDVNIIRIGTQGTQTATYLAGNVFANGVMLTSDRNAKENFQPVDYQMVLAKVASLPVTEWNYKTDSKEVQHIGPMAQDFQAAFKLDGTDNKHISVVDEGGVALAAIQGLNQKLQDELNRQDAENVKLKQQNDSLAARLNELETEVQSLGEKK